MLSFLALLLAFIVERLYTFCWRKGWYRYSVLIGIKGDLDDSIEDIRVDASWDYIAKERALKKYSKENDVSINDLIVFEVTRLMS